MYCCRATAIVSIIIDTHGILDSLRVARASWVISPMVKGIVLLGKQCLYKLVVAVVVDQAAVCDDLAFSVCQCSNRAFEWCHAPVDAVGAVSLGSVCFGKMLLVHGRSHLLACSQRWWNRCQFLRDLLRVLLSSMLYRPSGSRCLSLWAWFTLTRYDWITVIIFTLMCQFPMGMVHKGFNKAKS